MHQGGNFMDVRVDRCFCLFFFPLFLLLLFWEVALLTQNRQAIVDLLYYFLRGCTTVNVRIRVLRRRCPHLVRKSWYCRSLVRFLFPRAVWTDKTDSHRRVLSHAIVLCF